MAKARNGRELAKQMQPQCDMLMQQIEAGSRQPFKEVLAILLSGRPTPKDVEEFARKHPDRWAQSLTMAGKLAGYTNDLGDLGGGTLAGLAQLSMAELAKLAGVEHAGDVIDLVAEEVEEPHSETDAVSVASEKTDTKKPST